MNKYTFISRIVRIILSLITRQLESFFAIQFRRSQRDQDFIHYVDRVTWTDYNSANI